MRKRQCWSSQRAKISAKRGLKRLTLSVPSGCNSALSLTNGLGACLLLCGAPATSFAQSNSADTPSNDLSVSLGGTIWDGNFGAATSSRISSALLGVRYRTGNLRLTASIPWMRIRSEGTFFTGIGGTPIFVAPGVPTLDSVREGVGDLTLGAAYLLPGGRARGFDLEISGRAKVPTASASSQLSTGKADYSAGAAVSKTMGRLTPSVGAAYRIFGDTQTWNFRDGFQINAGATYALTNRTVLLASYEYGQAATHLIDDSHQVVVGASAPIGSSKLRITGFVSKGLSQGAADVSGGASLSFTL